MGASADCACFGIFLRLNPWVMLLVDSGLLLASMTSLKLFLTKQSKADIAEPRQYKSEKLPFLIGLLLIAIWCFFRVLPHDPVLRMTISALLVPPRRASAFNPIKPSMLQHDPPLGALLPTPAIPRMKVRRPTFVVFTTGCSLCSLGVVGSAAQEARLDDDNLIVVSPSVVATMRRFMKDHEIEVSVVSDPEHRYNSAYNVSFLPRAYLLDRGGRLAWSRIPFVLQSMTLVALS